MKRLAYLVLAAGLLGGPVIACVAGCSPPQPGQLRPQPAIDLILAAFESHPLVGLSEGAGHGQLETRDFFIKLIRDARFPRTVQNIVVEFGNARYQSLMDRYVSGEAVTREELRQVWENTTQISAVWSLPMYERMFAEVRTINATLPARLRLRVLLGDPPIDWSNVTSPADDDMNDWRDAHFAHVVQREITSHGKKALLLIGGAHLGRRVILPDSLIHLLDARLPGQTWTVGVLDPSQVSQAVEHELQAWKVPGGAAVRNTWLGKLDVQQIGFHLSRGTVEEDIDAFLLLSSSSPTQDQAVSLDARYEVELARRRFLARATLPFRGAQIRFSENHHSFAPDAQQPLQAVAAELLEDRHLRLLVKAFADSSEPEPANLSARRAEHVVDWLVQRGIDRDRLLPRGCSDLRALSFGKTTAERAMNRRAELVRLTPTAGCEPPWSAR
jgi:outer membrane protein OmpA-like peptidoglycan-associated protein